MNPRPCKDFVLVATPHKGDQVVGSPLAPDCGFYPLGRAPVVDSGTSYGRVDWSHLEIIVEAKVDASTDPFNSNAPDAVTEAKKRKETLGQILSYSELLLQHQHRMFHFTVLLLGHEARILRIDRSGIFVTERFDYVKKESKLVNFLWRYSRLSAELRGHDPTVERITQHGLNHSLAKLMRDKLTAAQRNAAILDAGITAKEDRSYIPELFKASLDPDYPWWKLQVHDELNNSEVKYFVVGKPHFQAAGVRGRGTRGYVAVLLNVDGTLGEDFVYLKDAWRVYHPSVEKEGNTLKRLNEHNVPYVPTLLCHGDLPGQITLSPRKWEEHRPSDHCLLKEHQHYRMVVKEVGKPLSSLQAQRPTSEGTLALHKG